ARIPHQTPALASTENAMAISRDDMTLYQVACLYALLANAEKEEDRTEYGRRAVALLAEAVRKKPRWATVALSDPDLVAIRELADFDTLTSAAVTLLEVGKTGLVDPPSEAVR
ncbi:MAG: hypothetical protein ACC645_14065, partial [Pirellulales bacterium]